MDLFELSARSKGLFWDRVSGGLDDGLGGFCDALHVVLWHTTGTEDVSVGEVLGGQVTYGKLGKHDLGTGL